MSLNSQMERENELKYNNMTLKLTKEPFVSQGHILLGLINTGNAFFFLTKSF